MEKVALVTGASRGLGYACALELVKQGYHILALARTTGALEELDDVIQTQGGQATLIPLDITDKDGLARMGAAVFQRWGKLDCLVHCAVYAAPLTPAHMIPDKELGKSIAVNVAATAHVLSMCTPLLNASSEAIVHFFDDTHTNTTFSGAYGLSKAAQIHLAQTFVQEVASSPSIRVHIHTPPPMPTAVRGRFYPGEDRSSLYPPASVATNIMRT